jgi:hypothetical protein
MAPTSAPGFVPSPATPRNGLDGDRWNSPPPTNPTALRLAGKKFLTGYAETIETEPQRRLPTNNAPGTATTDRVLALEELCPSRV